MSWKNYEVIIEVTDQHRIIVKAQSMENARFRAEKILDAGVGTYEFVPGVDRHIRNVQEIPDD